jgi:dTDP-4-dehydrorhamnose reductase
MIDQKTILFTGGSGLLGREIQKLLPDAHFPESMQFDITNFDQMKNFLRKLSIELIVHAAAFTSPPRIDNDPEKAIQINIIGTANIVKLCMQYHLKLIYISTDYVFNGDKGHYKEDDPVFPVNKYAWSKLGGECAVQLYENALIVRTSFGPDAFPYDKAFADQWTSRECVGKIAKKIVSLLDMDIKGILHIGGNRKTVLEYARELSGDKLIKPLYRNKVDFKVPKDTSLDCSRYNSRIQNH